MNKLIMMIALMILTLSLSGCSLLDGTPLQAFGDRIDGIVTNPFNDPTKEHPEDNLKQFLACLQNQDYAGATVYASKQARQALTEEFLKGMDVGDGFNCTKVKIATDTKSQKKDLSKVYVYFKYNEEPEGSLGQEAVMVKENGKWQVLSFGEFSDY